MVGFKPWPSWIGRDHSANWAKTTAPDLRLRGHGALYRLKQKGDVFMLNQKIMQCMRWHSSIVVWCWADPVVHLLLLKSSRTKAYFFWGGHSPQASCRQNFISSSQLKNPIRLRVLNVQSFSRNNFRLFRKTSRRRRPLEKKRPFSGMGSV